MRWPGYRFADERIRGTRPKDPIDDICEAGRMDWL